MTCTCGDLTALLLEHLVSREDIQTAPAGCPVHRPDSTSPEPIALNDDDRLAAVISRAVGAPVTLEGASDV